MNNLFILGAGASKSAGAPLMNEFLDTAEKYSVLGKIDKETHQTVFRAIEELQNIFAKSYLDLDNIEALFGAVEMSLILKRLGNFNKNKLVKLRNALIKIIYRTIEESTKFRYKNGEVVPSKTYASLTNLINHPHLNYKNKFSFITFNYDVALDYALKCYNHEFGYYLDSDTSIGIPLLKLHGSINWGTCLNCKKIIPFYPNINPFEILTDKTEYVLFKLGSNLVKNTHCGRKLSNLPLIIPPTWNKSYYHKSIQNVWRKASEEISNAENIFIIGYSLPETDSFFKYLYSLSISASTRIKKFWVFNPDDRVESRFRDMIGKGIEKRFRFFDEPFEGSLNIINDAIL